eukprot:g4850.t1
MVLNSWDWKVGWTGKSGPQEEVLDREGICVFFIISSFLLANLCGHSSHRLQVQISSDIRWQPPAKVTRYTRHRARCRKKWQSVRIKYRQTKSVATPHEVTVDCALLVLHPLRTTRHTFATFFNRGRFGRFFPKQIFRILSRPSKIRLKLS